MSDASWQHLRGGSRLGRASLSGALVLALMGGASLAQTAATPAAKAPQPPRLAVARRPAVAVFGDHFADALAEGVENDPAVQVVGATGEGEGLARPGFADWIASIRDRLAKPDRPALALLMVGADEHQALSDAAGTFQPGTPGWSRIYGDRVDAVARLFRDARVPLVWVGLPPVRSPELTADFVRQNGIVRDRAGPDGVTYVDSFDGFTDDAGRYSPIGPDLDGAVTKLRRAGGLGFTHAGARKLASFAAPEVARLARSSAAASGDDIASLTVERARDFDAALDVDVNAQIRREAVRGPAAPTRDAPAEQAAAGAVLPLNAPSVSPDGQLASLAPSAGAPPGSEPIAPRPGRADDFAWPKP